MASIFLSYARDDLPTAKRIAAGLEAAGHSVWWDQHIGAGSRFSKEIDAALKAADLVVVLWSRSSVESTWVQDEAAFGRDRGRLLPLAIDGAEPPLGFRQFQALPITRSARKVDTVVAAIASRLGQPAAVARRRSTPGLPAWWRWGALAVLAIAVAAGLFLMLRDRAGGTSHVVAVVAAEGGDQRRSQELARIIAADLGRFRAGPLGALTVVGGDQGKGRDADYRVEAAVSQSGSDLRADVSLLSAKGSQILWTTSVQGPADTLVDLRQRAVARLGDVLTCAVEADTYSRKISQEVLGLYLNGCSLMNDLNTSEPDEETLSIFRQVTEKAPDFAPGWGNLAYIEVLSFPGTAPTDRPALAKAVDAHLKRAKQLDPTFPTTVAADAQFHPNDGTKPGHALPILERGLAAHPDSAILRDMRAYFLGTVGRVNESIAESQRATKLNPLSPVIRSSYISSLAYAGRTAAAFRELEEAEKIWPGSAVIDQTRYRLDLRYGDPKKALKQLQDRGAGDLTPVPGDTAWAAFLTARIDPTPANVEKALDAFRARYRRANAHIVSYIQTLGTFRRVDEAYEVVWTPESLDSLMAGTDLLFRTHMRSIQADQRFIALAAKLGLLQYWEKTGVWADFCRDPGLPYDCKAEAAKLTPEQRKIARHIVG